MNEEKKEMTTLEAIDGINVEVEDYDPEKGEQTLKDPKYDWSGKITDGKGADAE